MLIIGLMGRKGAGKDSFFKQLSCSKKVVKRLAFADPLKEEVSRAMGVSLDFIEANKNKWWMRTLLQIWGTEFRREHCGEDYWVKKMQQQVARISLSADIIVITDVRFISEANYVRGARGILVRVTRPESLATKVKRLLSRAHQSEKEAEKVPADYVIRNDCFEDGMGSLGISAIQLTKELRRRELWPE